MNDSAPGRMRPSMLEFMDAVAVNAVEDKLKMGLDRNAAALLVAGSDERGRSASEDAEVIANVFSEHGATELFATDDPDHGADLGEPGVDRCGNLTLPIDTSLVSVVPMRHDGYSVSWFAGPVPPR